MKDFFMYYFLKVFEKTIFIFIFDPENENKY